MNLYKIIISLSMVILISIILNIGFVWYTRQALQRLMFVSGNMSDLRAMIEGFKNHLERVYNLENYYGDETLSHLLEHAKDLSTQLEDYRDIYTLVELDEQIVEEEEDDVETQEPKLQIGVGLGDRVKINEGTFENFEGDVDAIDEMNGRVTVMINIFGRSTPVELEHWQIEKL